MSENNEFDRTAAESGDEAAEGQYVEGDYGAAGTAGENPPEAAEGEYPTGDYGAAGVSGTTAVGAEEGDYPEGDYGEAGADTTPPTAALFQETEAAGSVLNRSIKSAVTNTADTT